VGLLVFYDETPTGDQRNNQATFWFRWSEDADRVSGLPLKDQGLFYFASLIGMPRNLLCQLRPNLPAPLVTDQPNYWETVANSPNPAMQLGCLSVRMGFAANQLAIHAPFAPFTPTTSASAADTVVYSTDTKTNFDFSSAPLPPWQVHFAKLFSALLRERNVPAVMLHLPLQTEVRSPVMAERIFWPEIFSSRFTLLGIPSPKLFGTLTDADVLKLYADPHHFNQNGQDYFTALITPVLLKLYETATNR
jgi:hypothetical protein